MNDKSYSEEHYHNTIGYEPIEVMQRVLNPEEFRGFLKGNIIKYSMRAGKKLGESAVSDMQKAQQYAEWLHLVQPWFGALIKPKGDTTNGN